MRTLEGSGDEWRKENDLDCLYFNGDLRADTLMSAWTLVKWVADFFNKENGMKFYKKAKDKEDKYYYIRLLAEDRDKYLPPEHFLTMLLNDFLELAEQRCNYILLPDRRMNPERYKLSANGENLWLFDEVPATLFHIFQPDTLGKYFNGDITAEEWIKREHLEMGFYKRKISQDNVIPFMIEGLLPQDAKWMTEEYEIKQTLEYMIRFLRCRYIVLDYADKHEV